MIVLEIEHITDLSGLFGFFPLLSEEKTLHPIPTFLRFEMKKKQKELSWDSNVIG